MRSKKFKGYLLAFLATIAFSNVYIFSKAALDEVHIAQFGFYWFSIGFLLNIIYMIISKRFLPLFQLSKKEYRILILLGIVEIFTTATFFLSIQIIPDPAVTSFLGNMYPVFLALFGILFLHEKFRLSEAVGAIIAMSGAFIISYNRNRTLGNLFLPGSEIVLLNAILAATGSVIVKKHVNNIRPEILNLNRSLWLVIFTFIMIVLFGKSFHIPGPALKNIAIGSFLGPFLSILLIYHSFKYMDASKSAIIQSLKGIFVLIGAWLYFHSFPLPYQLAGGVATIAGVLAMAFFKQKKEKHVQ